MPASEASPVAGLYVTIRPGQAGEGWGRLGQARGGGRRGKKEEVVHISASIRARAARNFVQKEPCATATHAAPRTAFWRRGRGGVAPAAAISRLRSCCCRDRLAA